MKSLPADIAIARDQQIARLEEARAAAHREIERQFEETIQKIAASLAKIELDFL
jgi:hypothetical protein